jgi:hypothetical protein
MKKILFTLLIFFTLSSCRFDIEPTVTINLTVDGENIDGIQGEWIISSEDKEEKDGIKKTIIITIEKNELDEN